ncbi:MAG: CDP-alcohol phosphatidyltransferase family protein [Saprospirales bacterium]|nr:CDP-alcohol phosphatidyltransferase family protein [Saprospirales bacterium]
MRKHIPNLFTLANLFFGCLAIVAVLHGEYQLTFWLILLAIFADYVDGGVARALKVSSPLGKELDSIADAVSFGVVPGAIFYQLLSISTHCTGETICWAAIPGFIVSAAAGLRLARFNLDTRQTENFIGLPTPSLTMFALGLLMIHESNSFGMGALLEKTWVLYVLVGFLSYISNAPLPMFSLKFKSFAWKGNEIKFIFGGIGIVLLALWREAAFAPIIALYILISIILKIK